MEAWVVTSMVFLASSWLILQTWRGVLDQPLWVFQLQDHLLLDPLVKIQLLDHPLSFHQYHCWLLA